MSRRILVTGASVAGTTAAWWLTRFGFEVDVVEKASAFREGGQNVDVRGSAREVLSRMGLEKAAFERSTPELGTEWVDEHNNTIARFEAGATGSDNAPTAELEIRRGDIARLIYDAARERASFRFGDSVAAVSQHGAGAEVTSDHTLVFKLGSKTRRGVSASSPAIQKMLTRDKAQRRRLISIGHRKQPFRLPAPIGSTG